MSGVLKRSRVNLTEGPIFKNLLIFAIPIFLGSIVTQFYNIADSVIVGKYVSSDAMAAVAASGPVMNIINMFMIGLSSGTTVCVAQRTGTKSKEALQKVVGTVAFLTIAASIFITVLGLFICKPLLVALDTPANILNDAVIYLSIIYIGTIGNLSYNMGNGIMQGMGDSYWSFIFLFICSIVHVILDLIMVLVFDMGVLGVGIATAVSQLVSAIGLVWRINNGNYGITLTLKDIRLDKEETKKIIGIGLPASIQNAGNSVAALCVQPYINMFTSDFISANNIVTRVDQLINIPIVALSTALCTFVAQNIGLLNFDRIKEGINKCIVSLCGMGVGLCILLILGRNHFPLIFTDEPAVIAYAARGLLIMSALCPVYGIDRCLVNAMRGAGKSVVPMVTAQFGAFSRIPLAYFLAARTGNYEGIFFAMLAASYLRMIAIAVYYYGGGWKSAVKKIIAKHEAEQAKKVVEQQ